MGLSSGERGKVEATVTDPRRNAKPDTRASVVETLRTPPWRDVHAWLQPELDEGER